MTLHFFPGFLAPKYLQYHLYLHPNGRFKCQLDIQVCDELYRNKTSDQKLQVSNLENPVAVPIFFK